MINVIFEDNVDLYWARTRVLERLNLVTAQLPSGVVPTLGPDATGVGQIFWYTLESDQINLRDLRTLQDWFVRYQLNSVDRKSTRLNSSHPSISYAVFCLKKKKKNYRKIQS